MFSKIAEWWNDEEQTLLRHETARARRFFCSKTGLLLIVMQCILVFWPTRWSIFSFLIASFSSKALTINLISIYFGTFIGPLISNIIWLWLFNEFVAKRLSGTSLAELRVIPLTPRMLWPALLSIPLVWCGIKTSIELIATWPMSFHWRAMIFSLAVHMQGLLLLGLFTLAGAVFLNARTSIAKLCGIVLVTNFAYFLCLNLIQYLIWSLPDMISGPADVLNTFSPSKMILEKTLISVVLLAADFLLLYRLRRTKGLDAFVEEEVTRRPSSVVSSSGGS